MNLTPEGLEWLKTALDPFPDETRRSPGFPDMISSKSIRYPIKIETQITDGGIGAPWDCNIAFQGLFGTNKLRQTVRTFNTFTNAAQGVTDYDVGGFQVRRAAAGTSLNATTITTNSLLPTLPLNPFRVVSIGMEVQNQTEPLYRSGGSVAYRMPSVPFEPTSVGVNNTAAALQYGTPYLSFSLRELPLTTAEALNIPDSVEDAAENGCYMVGTMDGPTNQPNQVVSQGNFSKLPYLISNAVDYFPQIQASATPPYGVTGTSNTQIPYNAFGVFFNNLSSQTKLKVIMHAFIEEFPPPSSTLLTSLATPSAPYDPEALVLYSKAIRHLPISVPACENFLGGFFLQAAKSIATWAAPKLLKGWGKDPQEESELKKIERELEVLKEVRKLELEERRRVIPRQLVITPTSGPKITRTNNNGIPNNNRSPPPLPPRDYIQNKNKGGQKQNTRGALSSSKH